MKTLIAISLSSMLFISFNTFANDDATTNSTTNTSTKSTKTNMDSNWTCTTNASSSDKSSDKDADKQMSDKAGSAHKSFKFAAKHCRDCTKITCSVKE